MREWPHGGNDQCPKDTISSPSCHMRQRMVAGPWKPGSPTPGSAAHRFKVSLHFGAAFTFVPSFTGGSILIFGPCTFGSSPAPGFSSNR